MDVDPKERTHSEGDGEMREAKVQRVSRSDPRCVGPVFGINFFFTWHHFYRMDVDSKERTLSESDGGGREEKVPSRSDHKSVVVMVSI